MPIHTFTVFQDQNTSTSATTGTSSGTAHDTLPVATKENINPLTGLVFDAQPPLKKRKPSSSSALKVKPLPSSSKPSSKSKRLSSTNAGKEKGKRKSVLGFNSNRNSTECMELYGGSETEQLRTALGNRNAYDLTVMPLADVTRAYEESETITSVARGEKCTADDKENTTMGMVLYALSEENDVEMCDIISKETLTSTQATQA